MRLFAGTPFDIPPDPDKPDDAVAEELAAPNQKPVRLPRLTVRMEKRKKGRWVTTVRGLDSNDTQLTQLLTDLKNRLGTGGTIQDGIIELQGDHQERLPPILTEKGYRLGK